MQVREKVGKSRNGVFFSVAGAETCGQMGDEKLHAVVTRSTIGCTKDTRVGPLLEVELSKKCTLLLHEAHLEVKMYKAPQLRTTFGSCDVEKMHAVVARSTFASQNTQSTPVSDHFWKMRCWKRVRRCGAKHIWKSKVSKHTILGPLLEIQRWNYNPVDPNQLFHIHSVILAPDVGSFEPISNENSMVTSNFFMYHYYLGDLCWCNSWEKKTLREKRTEIED